MSREANIDHDEEVVLVLLHHQLVALPAVLVNLLFLHKNYYNISNGGLFCSQQISILGEGYHLNRHLKFNRLCLSC